MARAKANPQIQDAEFVEITTPTENLEDELIEDTPEDIALANVLADMGEGDNSGKVNVYKLIDGVYRNQMFLFECLPSEFNMSLLQNPDYHQDEKEKHMFKIVLRNSTGIVKGKTLTVMPMAKKAEVLPPAAMDLTPIATMIQQNNDNFAKLLERLATPTNPPVTMEGMMQQMLTMKTLMGLDQVRAPATDPMQVITLAKELAEVMNPEASNSGTGLMMKMLELFGTQLAETIKQMPATPQPGGARIMPNPAKPADTAQAIEMPSQPDNTNGAQDMNFILNQSLNFLLGQAKRDADPVLYADLVLDQAGDDIMQLLDDPKWFDNLKALKPEVAQYEKWFTDLRVEIMKALTESANNDTNAETETEVLAPEELPDGAKTIESVNDDDGATGANT